MKLKSSIGYHTVLESSTYCKDVTISSFNRKYYIQCWWGSDPTLLFSL